MREHVPAIEDADSAATGFAGTDGAVVGTDWDEFATLDDEFAAMATPVVVDGHRIIEPTADLVYEGLTW